MSNAKIKLFLTFIIFSIILSIASISADAIFFGNTTEKIALQNATKKVGERETVLKIFLEQSKATLHSLRELELFEKYLNGNIEKSILEDIFLSHSKSQPNFMQLRYIDKNGQEQIRIDRDKEDADAYTVSKIKLQNKYDRYYFKDSIKKELEKVWFSALDLNVERGKVELPFKPTIRAIYPINHNGEFGGILIINYFMKNFLAKFINAPLYDMILSNKSGFPLIHYTNEKSWGFYKKAKFTIASDFPQEYQKILSKGLYITDKFVSKRLDIPIEDELYLILQLKQSYLDAQQKQKIQQQILVASIIFIFSLVLSILIVKRFSTTLLNLKKITSLNENLNSASKIAKIGFFEHLPKTNKLVWSPGVYEIFDIKNTKENITKEKFLEFLPESQKETLQKVWQESIEKQEEFFLIHQIETKNYIKVVEHRAKHFFDENGIYIKSVGSVYDITNSYQQQEKLANMNRELEETNDELEATLENLSALHKNLAEEKTKYKNILDFASDGIHIVDKNGNLLECSHSFSKMLGYTLEEIYTKNIKDWDLNIDTLQNLLFNLEIKPQTIETQYKTKNGETLDVQVHAKLIEIDGEKHIYSSSRDITEQKNTQRILQEQKDEFEAVFNYSKEGIAITDLEANFLTCNNAYLKMTGFTEEEILTKNCKELTYEEDWEKNEAAFKAVMEFGFIENFEKRCIRQDGRQLTVMMTISLLPDKERLLLVAKDMTTLKLLEEQSKLASMGEMIGNIAHQWRQPLSIITTSAGALELKADVDEVTKEDITSFATMIVDQSNYLSKTIDDFKNFIKGDVHYTQTSLKEVLQETLRLIDASLKGNFINLITDIKEDLTILGNKNELEQAFINILNNAKDALRELDQKTSPRYMFITIKKPDKHSIMIELLDNAGGIEEDIIHRIFEPYFSTKHKSLGTGLGLSMTDKIVRQRHKGTIHVFNKEFEYKNKNYTGACFQVIFNTQKDLSKEQ